MLSMWLCTNHEDEMEILSKLAFIHFTSSYIYSSCKQPIPMMEYNLSKQDCVPLLYYVCAGVCGGFLDGNRASETTPTLRFHVSA